MNRSIIKALCIIMAVIGLILVITSVVIRTSVERALLHLDLASMIGFKLDVSPSLVRELNKVARTLGVPLDSLLDSSTLGQLRTYGSTPAMFWGGLMLMLLGIAGFIYLVKTDRPKRTGYTPDFGKAYDPYSQNTDF